jgi:glycosyltransferase involved in cell wall biosynthesis
VTQVRFAIPGDLATPTGGYGYDRQVMAKLPEFGIDIRHLPLPGSFPFPSEADLDETADRLAGIGESAVLLIDGLALGAFPVRLLDRIGAPVIAMLHHPLGLETGLSAAESEALLALEKVALTRTRAVIVTSRTTAETLAELGFAPPPPVIVAEPGTEPARRAVGGGGVCEILSVGAVVPRKGHDLLIAALAALADLDWCCTIAGSLDRDGAYAAGLMGQIEDAGLGSRIAFAGPMSAEALDELYAKADIFALPSRYEGYGMAFAEALARGLPVIAARAGAVPGTVPPDAGILVPPDDAGALKEALSLLIGDRGRRRALSDAAWAHAGRLPRWRDTARIIAEVIKGVAG